MVQRRETTYLVMEYASEGELQDRIIKVGSLEESETRRLFAQIVHAVQYCHDHHIVHRDIKASNILIDCRGNAKLCDFGWTKAGRFLWHAALLCPGTLASREI